MARPLPMVPRLETMPETTVLKSVKGTVVATSTTANLGKKERFLN